MGSKILEEGDFSLIVRILFNDAKFDFDTANL